MVERCTIFGGLFNSGKKLGFFLVLTLIIDIGCYVIAYNFPEYVDELATPFEKHFDSIFAVIIVGFTVGIIMKFQLKVFERERMITEQQQEELKSMSKAKNVFFASMIHEIRTPINSIIGLNELILVERCTIFGGLFNRRYESSLP